jgi:hypothetical protein
MNILHGDLNPFDGMARTTVPEPPVVIMFLAGTVGLAVWRRARKPPQLP